MILTWSKRSLIGGLARKKWGGFGKDWMEMTPARVAKWRVASRLASRHKREHEAVFNATFSRFLRHDFAAGGGDATQHRLHFQ